RTGRARCRRGSERPRRLGPDRARRAPAPPPALDPHRSGPGHRLPGRHPARGGRGAAVRSGADRLLRAGRAGRARRALPRRFRLPDADHHPGVLAAGGHRSAPGAGRRRVRRGHLRGLPRRHRTGDRGGPPGAGPARYPGPGTDGGRRRRAGAGHAGDAPDSAAAETTVRQVRADFADKELDALVGGVTATSIDTNDASAHDRALIIPVVLVVIVLILMLLLRAVLAPLLLIATTVLSFGTAMGVSALAFDHLFAFPGADPAVPLFGFVFLVALGIDYNIFLMTRVREEALAHGTGERIVRGLSVT